jgi:hypothetical protein
MTAAARGVAAAVSWRRASWPWTLAGVGRGRRGTLVLAARGCPGRGRPRLRPSRGASAVAFLAAPIAGCVGGGILGGAARRGCLGGCCPGGAHRDCVGGCCPWRRPPRLRRRLLSLAAPTATASAVAVPGGARRGCVGGCCPGVTVLAAAIAGVVAVAVLAADVVGSWPWRREPWACPPRGGGRVSGRGVSCQWRWRLGRAGCRNPRGHPVRRSRGLRGRGVSWPWSLAGWSWRR